MIVTSTEHVTVRYVIIAVRSNTLLITYYVRALVRAMVHSCIKYLWVIQLAAVNLIVYVDNTMHRKKNSPENYFVCKVTGYSND
jgi:hypothetical protein